MIRTLAAAALILLLTPRTGTAEAKPEGVAGQPAVRPAVYITPADVARARENMRRFAWAKEVGDGIIRAAEVWAARDDAWLLAQVPGKGACFAYGFTGCPICGGAWGIWDKARASFDRPGTVTCENGHVLPDADHPDPGTGYIGPDGRCHYFVGSYNAWVIEKLTLDGAETLATAYSLTGDERFAAKAALILDAVAAIYPSCDKGSWDYPSNPPSGRLDRPWYQVSRVLVRLIDHYDRLHASPSLDRPSVVSGLTRRRNIEDNMLRNGAAYCYEQSQAGGLNNGEADYLRGVLAAGICLGIPEYIRWAVDGPFGILTMLENNVGRDGQYYETSALYADHARSLYLTFSEPLVNCRVEPYPEGLDLYAHPKFKALLTLANTALDGAGHRPSFGDTAPDVEKRPATGKTPNPSDLQALEILLARTPEGPARAGLATLLRRLAGGDVDLSRRTALDARWLLFHAGEVPPAAAAVPKPLAARLEGSHVLGQKGVAVLRAGNRDEARALLLRFGPSLNHGHLDDLNINFFAAGYELTYDLGYDLASTHTQVGWARQTASHNLVVVDEASQGPETGGGLRLFASFPGLQVAEASAESGYATRGVDLYRRTCALVGEGPGAYLLDIFRVRGGSRHDYLFHTLGRLSEVSGIAPDSEEKGSLAGPDVEWGNRQINDGDMAGTPNLPYWNPPPGNGYGFLVKPRRAQAPGSWTADWRLADGTAVRLFAAPQPGTEVVLAEAPGIKPNLPRPHYVIARRRGEQLTSLFAAVIESATGEFSVESLAPISLEGRPGETAAAGFRVMSRGGVEDIIYSSGDDERRSGGGFIFAGRFIHARFSNGSLEALRLVGAKTFEGRGWAVRRPASGWEGRVEAVDAAAGRVTTSTPLPVDGSLAGAFASFVRGTGGRSSSYRIARVTGAGTARTMELDETILLGRGVVDEIRDGRTILSPVPHEFGRGVSRGDSGYFRGALVRSAEGATAVVRSMKPGRSLEIETDDASSFRKGEAFVYEDITPGGGFRIEAITALERSSTGVYALKGAARPEVMAPPGHIVRGEGR
jgi:hypothetical protein